MKIKEIIEIEMDDCLGFYINLDCIVYTDKSFKYRIRKEYYKYDKLEIEDTFFDTDEESKREFDLIIEEYR
ncbi:hypothetical protein [Candidatus Sulfurimonas baltica]|uniref:Uncharacterized protein n=1 Tax=Candidatus Sulfurimonas baltica TaxID=2740404 RepID=A0A7S7LVI5_9BACT|nr:hypothetical protein [Candidatus Sulfurimonas baltica]QOY52284.1 hypothetical protein HUE88_00895 [Candidatus Sulfurimonas baltica]